MTEERKTVVTLHKGINAEEFLDHMTSTYGTDAIPARKVEIYNEKPDSVSNFDFVMTRQEAEILKQDPRVRDVRWGTKIENGIILKPYVLEESKNYNRSSNQLNTDYDWAKPECTSLTSRYNASANLSYQHAYNLTGSGVDVVIQDSGIEVDNPEWIARDGVTDRLQQIDWPSAAGLSGTYTQPADHYTDAYGHGTHCAGTAAGRLYGWAKDANIYAIKMIEDVDVYGVSASFNLIRGWHNNKTNGRPTVVNMSWGYISYYRNISSINYRGLITEE